YTEAQSVQLPKASTLRKYTPHRSSNPLYYLMPVLSTFAGGIVEIRNAIKVLQSRQTDWKMLREGRRSLTKGHQPAPHPELIALSLFDLDVQRAFTSPCSNGSCARAAHKKVPRTIPCVDLSGQSVEEA